MNHRHQPQPAEDVSAVFFERSQHRRRAVLRLLQRASQRRPVIVWLDDVQWGAESIALSQEILEARDQGRGKQVMGLVETEAGALGVNALHLEVGTGNARGQALYRKSGFAESGRLLMSKRLS